MALVSHTIVAACHTQDEFDRVVAQLDSGPYASAPRSVDGLTVTVSIPAEEQTIPG